MKALNNPTKADIQKIFEVLDILETIMDPKRHRELEDYIEDQLMSTPHFQQKLKEAESEATIPHEQVMAHLS